MIPRRWLNIHFQRMAEAMVGTSDGKKMRVRKIGWARSLTLSSSATPRETSSPIGTDIAAYNSVTRNDRQNTPSFSSPR
ncbi:MAG: hypothetical protein ABSH08_09420 [Tepidisphaeraceae bacterium]